MEEVCGYGNYAFTNQPLIFGDIILHATRGDSDVNDKYDKLYVFDKDGNLLWSFSSPDGGNTNLGGVVACKDYILVASYQGYVYSLSWNGNIRWKIKVGYEPLAMSLYDINGDGVPDALVGTDGDSSLHVLDGKTGREIWKFKTGYYVESSPALGDVDGDGKLEVVFGSYDDYLYALNGEDGSLLWKFKTGDDVESSPAIGDIDGDGKLEVVFGSLDYNVYALNGEDGSLLWKFKTGVNVFSSPALGDVDGDGKIDIVVASWDCYLYRFESTVKGGKVVWSRWHGDAYGTGAYWNAISFAEANLRGDVWNWKPQSYLEYWLTFVDKRLKENPLAVFEQETFKPAKNRVIYEAKLNIAKTKALKRAKAKLLQKLSVKLKNLVNELAKEAELYDTYAVEKIYKILLNEAYKEVNSLKGEFRADASNGVVYLLLEFPQKDFEKLSNKASQLIAQAITNPQFAQEQREEGLKNLNRLIAELSTGTTAQSDSELMREAKEYQQLLDRFNREREETKKVLYEALTAYREAAGVLFKYSDPKTQAFIRKWMEATEKVNQLKQTFKQLLQKSDELFSLLYKEARKIQDDNLRLQMLSLIRKKEFNFYERAQNAVRSFLALNRIIQKGNDTIKAIKIAGALSYVDKNLYTQIDTIKSDADKVFKQLGDLSKEGETILTKLVNNL